MSYCFMILKQIFDFFKGNLKIIKQDCQKHFLSSDFKKSFLWVLGIYFIGFLSLIQVNAPYKTDVSRVAEIHWINSDWGHSGRWLNDLMVYLFHFSSYPQDISPVSQLIALIFMTLATLIITWVIVSTQKQGRFVLTLACILGLAPYYLQVFSYTFDCLFYSFAILLSVFPFLTFVHKKAFYLLSSVCLMGVYCSFQAYVSFYMIMAVYLFSRDYFRGKKTVKELMKDILITTAVFLGITLIYCCLVRFIGAEHKDMAMQSSFCALSECWYVVKNNFMHATKGYFIHHWWGNALGNAFGLLLCCFVLFQVKIAWQSKRQAPQLLKITFGILTPALMLFFMFFWTLFFTMIYWNARVFVSFNLVFTVMALACQTEENHLLKKLFQMIGFIVFWGCFIFATRVGNLLDIQTKYQEIRLSTLATDLMPFDIKHITFRERRMHAPIVRKKAKEYPITGDLVSALQTKFARAYDLFFEFYRPDLHRCHDKKHTIEKILLDNAYHRLVQINDNCILIDLK